MNTPLPTSNRLAQISLIAVALNLSGCLYDFGGNDAAPQAPAPAPSNPAPSNPAPTVQTGIFAGTLIDAQNSQPVAGATISADGLQTTSNSRGEFRLEKIPVGTPVVQVRMTGFAPQTIGIQVNESVTTALNLVLTPVNVTRSLSAATGGVVEDAGSGMKLTLPANALIDANGQAYTGTAQVALARIDPAARPEAMPGTDYQIEGGGNMESFGAMDISLLDASGNPLRLAPGQSAEVLIPLSTRGQAEASTGLFYFNPQTGTWTEDGTLTLVTINGRQFYRGSVTRAGSVNADKRINPARLEGCLVDAAGKPVPYANVLAEGVNYSSLGRSRTDAQGRFGVAVRAESQASLYARWDNSFSARQALTTPKISTTQKLDQCLVLDQVLPPEPIPQPPAPSTPSASCVSGDDRLLFTGTPTDWCGMTSDYRLATFVPSVGASTLHSFSFRENANTGTTASLSLRATTVNGVTSQQVATFMVERGPYQMGCGMDGYPCDKITVKVVNGAVTFDLSSQPMKAGSGFVGNPTITGNLTYVGNVAALSQPQTQAPSTLPTSGTASGTLTTKGLDLNGQLNGATGDFRAGSYQWTGSGNTGVLTISDSRPATNLSYVVTLSNGQVTSVNARAGNKADGTPYTPYGCTSATDCRLINFDTAKRTLYFDAATLKGIDYKQGAMQVTGSITF